MTDSGPNWQILPALVGWIVGLLTAIQLQERQHRRQQLGPARLLLTELDRIQLELGWDDGALLDIPTSGVRVVAPTVHPWVQAIIAQFAPTSPILIGRFMMIEPFGEPLRLPQRAK